MRVRAALVLGLVALSLAACSHRHEPSALTLVYDHDGFVMEPPPVDSARPRWSRKQALAAITKHDPDGDKTRAWFGYYQGHPAWLAIANGVRLAIPGPPGGSTPTRGHRIAVFADGESPPREVTEVDGGGTAPRPNVAPPRRAYDGRLHITYITPGAAQVAGTPSKWMMQPAPRNVRPHMSVADAMNRSNAISVNQVDAKTTRVYFGVFTGTDVPGAVHGRSPGWLVVGTHLRTTIAGRDPGKFPQFAYGVSVFSDDLTQPWVSGRLFTVERPLAY